MNRFLKWLHPDRSTAWFMIVLIIYIAAVFVILALAIIGWVSS